MKNLILFGILTGGIIFIYRYFKRSAINRRRKYIDIFFFPQTIKGKISATYPHLTDAEINEVMKGLKEYFHICNIAGGKFVSMPSQVVDVAWHEFILFTKQYQNFCSRAIGRFLHHVPAEAMSTPTVAREGIQRAWRLSCKREKINPKLPTKLPILFNIDSKLKIANGFYYATNCKGINGSANNSSNSSSIYCAGDIGGGCGSTGCGGSPGNGCGASCGGGCGGGD